MGTVSAPEIDLRCLVEDGEGPEVEMDTQLVEKQLPLLPGQLWGVICVELAPETLIKNY